MRSAATAVSALVWALATPAMSQVIALPNSPVRFQLGPADSIHKGILDGIRPDSIFFSGCVNCARHRFALNEIARLDVKTPPPGSVARRVALGAAVGMGAGLVVGAMVGAIYDDKTCHKGDVQLCGLGTAVFSLAGIPVGAIAGGIIGRWTMRARWINAIPGAGRI